MRWLNCFRSTRKPSPTAEERLIAMRSALLNGEAKITAELLLEVVWKQDSAHEDQDLLEERDRWVESWIEAASPEWLWLCRDLLMGTAMDSRHDDLLNWLWLFTHDVALRYPEEAGSVFGPLVEFAGDHQDYASVFAQELLQSLALEATVNESSELEGIT